MKTSVQAQHLKPGDIVGSGEMVAGITIASIQWPSNKVCVSLCKADRERPERAYLRSVLWGKYTMINVERKE